MDLLGRGGGHHIADQTSRRTAGKSIGSGHRVTFEGVRELAALTAKKVKGIGRLEHPIPFT
jgi:hypothetical protein